MLRLLLSFGWFDAIWKNVKSEEYTGVNEDTRPQEKKDKDWTHEERATAFTGTNPFGNAKITVSPYPLENQKRTSSCVPHGIGLALAIERKADNEEYVQLSPIFIYRQRSNYPDEGSYPQEIFNLYKKNGAPVYSLLPTPETEEEANAIVIPSALTNDAAIYKGLNYFTLATTKNDINEIAKIAQQGHGVAITLFATYQEWAQEYPQIQVPGLARQYAAIRHEICVLPKSGFIENGIKYVTIQDSSAFGNRQIRYVSEDFIRARVFDAGYWDTVASYGGGPLPVGYTFTKILKVGATGSEVLALQKLLISQHVLPQDCATGTFGGLTLAGIHAFQNRFAADILMPLHLNTPTDIWGSACIAKANHLTHNV